MFLYLYLRTQAQITSLRVELVQKDSAFNTHVEEERSKEREREREMDKMRATERTLEREIRGLQQEKSDLRKEKDRLTLEGQRSREAFGREKAAAHNDDDDDVRGQAWSDTEGVNRSRSRYVLASALYSRWHMCVHAWHNTRYRSCIHAYAHSLEDFIAYIRNHAYVIPTHARTL